MRTVQIDIMIDALRNFELAVSQVYETFSTVFYSGKYKWKSLAEEKIMHAKWLSRMKLYHINQIVAPENTQITTQFINSYIQYLQELADKIRLDEISEKDAVHAALEIEDSILECSLLKIFNFNSPNGKAVQKQLIRETTNHRDKMILWLEMTEDKAQMVA